MYCVFLATHYIIFNLEHISEETQPGSISIMHYIYTNSTDQLWLKKWPTEKEKSNIFGM